MTKKQMKAHINSLEKQLEEKDGKSPESEVGGKNTGDVDYNTIHACISAAFAASSNPPLPPPSKAVVPAPSKAPTPAPSKRKSEQDPAHVAAIALQQIFKRNRN